MLKPSYRGVAFGQVIYSEKLTRTDRYCFPEDKDGEKMCIPVYEKRPVSHWVWDGNDWVAGDIWEMKMAENRKRGFRKPPGMRLR